MTNDSTEGEDPDARWPKDGDRLFVESSWRHDARVVSDKGERFYRLPMGYKRAGDLLVDQAATDVVDRANIIYAALFCYRQAIELFLKWLIDAFGKQQVYKPKHTHELGRLWERFMCIANERAAGESLGLDAAQQLIAEMDEADRRSDGFRYATDRDDIAFKFGDRGVDLDNLREVMQGLENFFECTYASFSHQDDISPEG